MGSFEVLNALTNLEDKTPEFFRDEIFAHGDLKVKRDAIQTLRDLNPDRKSIRILNEIMKLD